jgi:translocation and assembly module TamA
MSDPVARTDRIADVPNSGANCADIPRRWAGLLLISVLSVALNASPAAAKPVRYLTELPKVQDAQLQTALEASSMLSALEETSEPPGAAGLVRRATQDHERMWEALKSFGFYAGDVRLTIDDLPLDTENLIERIEARASGGPVTVRITVKQGPLFTIGRFEVLDAATEEPDLALEIDRAALGLDIGDPARAADVLRAEDHLIDQMRAQGHPFAAVPDRLVIVDHSTLKMYVMLFADPGPHALFGEVAIEGLDRMEPDFVRRRTDLGPGVPYSPDRIRAGRDNLHELQVFSRIRIETGEALDEQDRLPVTLIVAERPRRVIGFGADYNTSEGFGARARWGHRNLLGRAESLHLQAEVGRIGKNSVGDLDYDVNLRYQAPDFLTRNQTLRAELSGGRENPDAYRREAIEAYIGLDRRLSDTLEVFAGIGGERSRLDDFIDNEPLYFVSVPAGLRLDTSDDLLDPTSGYRAHVELRPYVVDRTFLRTSIAASTFHDMRENGDLVLAGRVRVGSIVGEELPDVPSDKRFFSGGAGSVRGYAFQAIGPRTLRDRPRGGRSLFELGLETRVRITDSIGVVPFVEGGQVFKEEFPSLKDNLQFGAGLGLRYFTPIGPLRLDVAFPIDKQEDDDSFQLYVSIGQAF